MKVSYKWLSQFVPFSYSPERISEILTQTGLEVEGIEAVGSIKGGLTGVITGEVIECDKHPDADKLKVTRVNVGNETLQIVCGAPNVAVGQKVLVALVGTTIYPNDGEPLTLRKAKIRGIESHGMICAEDELGLGTSHDGILILPQDTEIGIPASNALTLDTDYLLEIGLTPNRCDAMGHLGVARDIRAYLMHHEGLDEPLSLPEIDKTIIQSNSNKTHTVSADADCEAYYLASLSGVNVGPSPDWLKNRLSALGTASINNIVDCANYVMYELGTPLHAFDAGCFTQSLTVRNAHTDETLETLDGVHRKLRPSDLVIDGNGTAHCLAGVLGGKVSGVSETTTDLLIESAYFNPSTIRKTAKHHGIHSDASFRFERGVDPDLTAFALQRVVSLIRSVAGGSINYLHEVKAYSTPAVQVKLDFKTINKQLGTSLTDVQLSGILSSLDFKLINGSTWEIPRYRSDVKRPIDVTEEIIRIAGFDAVPTPDKWSFSVPISESFSAEATRQKVSVMLAANGFNEILNNSLTKASNAELTTSKQDGKPVVLKNPLSRDLSTLRTSMFFGALESLAYNKNRQAGNTKFFEFGHTYHGFGERTVEKSTLALVLTGSHEPDSWMGSRPFSFFDIKSEVMNVIEGLNPNAIEEVALGDGAPFSEGIEIKVNGKSLASLGKLSDPWLKTVDFKQTVYGALIDWKRWIELSKTRVDRYVEIPKTFVVRRDFALLLDSNVPYSALVKAAKKVATSRLIATNLFDVYEGDKIEEGKKSYALSFHFRDAEKTLTDAEIDQEMNLIRACFESDFGAQLR
ncbi:MAG: phenylalanine--tRNA ligase subunit beta [Flavobacteriales bacterium]